jgi:hypothetical protein
MENELKGLSVDQLKAKISDSLVVVENHQQFIKILNQELATRSNVENSRATQPVQEVVNKIINEKDETNEVKG